MSDKTEVNINEIFGLKHFYYPALNWAKTKEAKYALTALIHLGLIEEKPNCLGTFLQFISTLQSRELLDIWAESENSAQILRKLSDTVKSDPSIINNYPPLPESSASQQLRGDLPSHYLLAMIIEVPTEETEWLNKLTLWILVHAMHRTQFSIYKDKYISGISKRMRQASDQQYKYEDKQKHELLISNLREINSNETLLSLVDELPDTEGSSIIQTKDEDSDYLSTTVAPEDSYIHQKLKGTGILLNTSEELHFLPWSWTTINPREIKILEAWVEQLLQSSLLIENILGLFIWIAMLSFNLSRIVLISYLIRTDNSLVVR